MKKSTFITFFLIVSGSLLAQSEEKRSLSSFSEITAQEGINVYLKKGSKEEARVISRSHDLDEVLTEVSGEKLKIHIDEGFKWISGKVNVDVYVTYRSINKLNASSSASINSEEIIEVDGDFQIKVSSSADVYATIKGIDELEIEASSSGDVHLEVEANNIEASLSSAGSAELKGNAEYQYIRASSGADYKGYELESAQVDAKASSGASIKVYVSEKIEGRASSGGSVRYKGEPNNVNADTSSGGSVRKS